jgi:hypothetical protein
MPGASPLLGVGAPGRDRKAIMMRHDRDLLEPVKIPTPADDLIMPMTWR